MADRSPTIGEQTTVVNEYSGPDKCDEKIASVEDEVITVPGDESEIPEAKVDFLKACARCHKNFAETKHRSKLLPCLHSLCEECVLPSKDCQDDASCGSDITPCPHCSLIYDSHNILDNLFIQDLLMKDAKPDDAVDGEPTIHECTGCEEKETGTSFCIDCAEWLCDQCVTAHKRVRVTKDHKIVPKEEAPTTSDTNKSTEYFLYCKLHKQEKLMFFCEKCDILTCRDCQLVEHKDHKYQFLDVAAANYKATLQDHMYHMTDRSKKLGQVHAVIESKLGQVKTQHAQIVKQVQDQADSLIKQIIQSARQLLQNVKVACETMAKKLARESNDIVKILGKYDYCINFVEDVVKDGSNMALLLSKSAVLKECGRIYSIPIEAQSVKNQFVVQYKHDNQFLHNNLNRFGAIFVNNSRYHPQDKNYNNANPSQSSHPSYNAPPSYSVASQMMSSSAVEEKKKQLLMAINKATTSMSNPHMQSLLNQRITQQQHQQQQHQQQQHQQQQHQQQHIQQQQGGAIPPSVSNLVSQMRMNVPQANGWQQQQQQQMLRSNVQALNLQRAQYSAQQQQQQPFQPMRLQHRPATQQSVYTNPHGPPNRNAPNLPKAAVQPVQQQPQPARGPPPLIRSPNQNSTTPPSNNGRPSSAGPPSRPANDSSGLPSGVRVKQERRSSCENDCIITAAKVKGEKSPAQACSGSSPKTATQTSPAPGGGMWTSNTATASSESNHAAETEKNLEKVIEDLPMEDLPNLEDIDTTLMTAGTINKQLSAASELSRKPTQSPGKNGAAGMGYGSMGYTAVNSDPNEDFCACCHNGGEVLCCDTCPKVFHLQCHIPPLGAVPNGVFVCTLCSTGDDIRVSSPVSEEAMSNGSKRKAPGGLSDTEIKVCERLMLELFCHVNSVAFHEPVSKQVPNYYKIIQTPMDFSTIKSKLSRQHFNHYNSVEAFLSDVKLVFQNCATYNQENSEVGNAGKTVRVFFEELVAKYLPPYVTFASTYPPRQTYVNSDGASDPKRQRTEDPVMHIS